MDRPPAAIPTKETTNAPMARESNLPQTTLSPPKLLSWPGVIFAKLNVPCSRRVNHCVLSMLGRPITPHRSVRAALFTPATTPAQLPTPAI